MRGGATLVSDPVALTVPALADLAIDLYLPGDTSTSISPVTLHPAAWQTNYVSRGGNHAGAADFPIQATTTFTRNGLPSSSWFFLARVEARSAGDEEFGRERFIASVRSAHGQEPAAVLEQLLRDVREFTAGAPQADDLTVVIVRQRES